MSRVYFARREDTGLIKIGFSTNVRKRMWAVKTEIKAPVKLLVSAPGSFMDEARMHHKFLDSLAIGEWFWPTPELMKFIRTVRRTGFIPSHPMAVKHCGFEKFGNQTLPTFSLVQAFESKAA